MGLLLLVLAFTVGLGFGRRGARSAAGGPALNRPARAAPEKARAWYVQGKMPKEDLLTLEDIDPVALITDLTRLYGLPRNHIWVEEAAGDLYHLYIGPFISKSDAESYVERHDLRVVGVRGARPFRFAKIIQRPRR